VLGGARSGKSTFAEALVTAEPGPWVYLATAEPGDDEMRARIAAHRARRNDAWLTEEAPLALADAVTAGETAELPLLLDCLTLWLSNLMAAERDLMAETEALLSALGQRKGPAVLVSNEVGLGLVPDTALGRRFRDEAGRLNQRIAAAAQSVVFVAAGLPLYMKQA